MQRRGFLGALLAVPAAAWAALRPGPPADLWQWPLVHRRYGPGQVSAVAFKGSIKISDIWPPPFGPQPTWRQIVDQKRREDLEYMAEALPRLFGRAT